MKLLIVDGNEEFLDKAQQTLLLHQPEWEIAICAERKDALTNVKQEAPGIMILGPCLRDADRRTLLKKVHANESIVPLLAVTKETMHPREALDLGAFDFFGYPVVEEELITRVNAALMHNQEVCRRRQAEQALRESRTKITDILASFDDMVWFVSADTLQMVYINDTVATLFGYPIEEFYKNRSLFYDVVHPEDQPEFMEALKEALVTGTSETEYRVLRPGGEIRWIFSRSSLVYDDKGEASLIAGIAQDITMKKQTEDALIESERKFRSLVENANDLICSLDEEGTLLYVSPNWTQFQGHEPCEVIGKPFTEFLHPQDVETWNRFFKQTFLAGNNRGVEYRLQQKSGKWRWHIANFSAVRTRGEDTAPYVIGISHDITERKKMEDQLKFLSLNDALTGVYNRVYFEEEMRRIQDSRYDSVGLIICDVDGLKLINDTLGHETGDSYLKTTAGILQKCFRKSDLVARIGGDEFAIIFTNGNKAAMEKACQRINKEVQEFNKGYPALPLSISTGWAVGSKGGKTLAELFVEADNNMYREKLHHMHSTRSTIVKALKRTLEARDFITEGHTERVQDLVVDLARHLGLSENTISDLRLLAQFHDVGKVGVPDSILLKPGPLTPEEMKEMRRHCEIGLRIAVSAPDLAPIADKILTHHEWWNGEGYPLGLRQNEIPLESRILAVADAYDAMTSDRPYRKAMSKEEAAEELRKCAGTQFDPALAKSFLKVLGEKPRWRQRAKA